MCQQSIRWAMKQKLQLFSLSRGRLSQLRFGDSGVLAAYSLDVTHGIGSVCVGDEVYQERGITHTVQPDLWGGRGNMAHHR